MPGFIYLASPYSHPEMSVRVERFMAAQALCVYSAKLNISIFSPIVHWHHIAAMHDLPFTAEFWKFQNDPMIYACEGLCVLNIEDWQKSVGVSVELELANKLNKPILMATKFNETFLIQDFPSKLPLTISDTLTQSEDTRGLGFTGDICSACGGSHMQVAGHCQVCSDCGTTTGCS